MEKEYLGKANLLIKAWFYIENGTNVLNVFKYVIAGILLGYATLKLDNPIILFVMGVVSLPVLLIIGYVNVHKVSRVKEWLSIKYGSHYSIEQFNILKETLETLKRIEKRLSTQAISGTNDKISNNETSNKDTIL